MKAIKALVLGRVIPDCILCFRFPVSSIFHLSVIWVWICAFLKAILWIRPCVCVCLCLCLTAGSSLSLLDSRESNTMGMNEGHVTEIFIGFRINSLTPTDPKWPKQHYKHYCLWNNNQMLCSPLSTFMVDIHFVSFLSTFTFSAFSKWYTGIVWVKVREAYIT